MSLFPLFRGLRLRVEGFVLATQPLWILPLLALLFIDSPYFWIGWIIALAPWPLRIARSGLAGLGTPFDIPIALLIAGLLVGLLRSPDLHRSLNALQGYLAMIPFYYSIVGGSWFRYARWWVAVMGLVLLVGSLWVFGHVQMVTFFNKRVVEMARELPNPVNYVPDPNGLGLLLALALAISAGVALFSPSPGGRVAGGLLSLFFGAVLFLSASGGGWLAAAVALAFLFLLRTRWALLGLPVIAGLSYLLVAFSLVPGAEWGQGFWAHSTGSILGRTPHWERTIVALKDSPLLGYGVATLPLLLSYPAFFPFNPHNAYLQLYADAGIIGAVAALWAMVAGARLLLHHLRAPRIAPGYALRAGVLAALLAGAVNAVFESTTVGILDDTAGNYHYIASPVLWTLAGLLAWSIRQRA